MAQPNKTVVKITVELPVMSATKAYQKALEIATAVREDENVRIKGITVVS